MKFFFSNQLNQIPIPLKFMEKESKLNLVNEKQINFSEWSTLNNSKSICYQSCKPISKCYIVKLK